jgi:hypothetical protein
LPTWFFVLFPRGTKQLVPPQQQLENNPKQESNKPHKHGWDGTTLAAPILVKNKNKANQTKKSSFLFGYSQ